MIYHFPPLDPDMGVQVSPKCQKRENNLSLYWNHFKWKSQRLLCCLKPQMNFFLEFPHSWENWEFFANLVFRNFWLWFSDFWHNFEWEFGAIHLLMFSDPQWPLGGHWADLTTENVSHQKSTQNFARNLKITIKTFKKLNLQKILSFLSYKEIPRKISFGISNSIITLDFSN